MVEKLRYAEVRGGGDEGGNCARSNDQILTKFGWKDGECMAKWENKIEEKRIRGGGEMEVCGGEKADPKRQDWRSDARRRGIVQEVMVGFE